MLRLAVLTPAVLGLEWGRALVERAGMSPVWPILLGGALCLVAVGWSPQALGLERSRLGLRLLGGLALGAVLLLPAAVRWQGAPVLPVPLAAAAIVISIGEEFAFRGALYAALDAVGGAPAAVVGSTVIFALGHVLTHPPGFLLAVLAAGLLLAGWRWACRDLVGPVIGHMLADLAL